MGFVNGRGQKNVQFNTGLTIRNWVRRDFDILEWVMEMVLILMILPKIFQVFLINIVVLGGKKDKDNFF
jgi:hypothetical protein